MIFVLSNKAQLFRGKVITSQNKKKYFKIFNLLNHFRSFYDVNYSEKEKLKRLKKLPYRMATNDDINWYLVNFADMPLPNNAVNYYWKGMTEPKLVKLSGKDNN